MKPIERPAFLVLAFLALVLLARCQPEPTWTPTPSPTIAPVCDPCDAATRIAALETRAAPSPTVFSFPSTAPTATPTVTPSPGLTQPATVTATPSRAPTVTQTPEPTVTPTSPLVPSLAVTVLGVAKPGGYVSFHFVYTGPPAQFGLRLIERTAFYGDAQPPVGCKTTGGVCWESDAVGGARETQAAIYFLSTWRVGETAILTAWWATAEEHMDVPVALLIGGGTPAPTATRHPTATPTRPSVAVLTLRAGQWAHISNPTLATVLRLYTAGSPARGWLNGDCGGGWDYTLGRWWAEPADCLVPCRRILAYDAGFDLLAWCANPAQGWLRLEVSHATDVWLWLQGDDRCTVAYTQAKFES